MSRRIAVAVFFLLFPVGASAHIGSPDVFLDVHAGPYRTLVTVRPPIVIPGVAEIDVRVLSPGARDVLIVPTPLTGAAAKFAPTPERVRPSVRDPQLFQGQVWMMTAGAWQVRVTIDGEQGTGTVSVPVPTLPQQTKGMDRALGVVLFSLMLLLCAGAVSIVAAIAREAGLEPGAVPTRRLRRRGWVAASIATVAIVVIVLLGRRWWNVEAANYGRYVYKPIEGVASIDAQNRLTLVLRDPGWISLRRLDDFIPDHGHDMHLFMVSPALDRLWHLHPSPTEPATFEQQLPGMPRGRYEYFADVVHASGIAETVTGTIDANGASGTPLAGDDAEWSGTVRNGALESPLPGGARMVWLRESKPLAKKTLTIFSFRVDDASGDPATDLELYMGMPAHAIFIRRDRQVFAHVHPSGSAPMAAIELSEQSLAASTGGATMSTHAMSMPKGTALPAVVSFPYGFPSAGGYRIFVQIKRHGRIETGVFDVAVTD